MNHTNPSEQTEYVEDEINLIDLFLVLLRHKKMIFLIVFAAIVLSVVYSLLKPDIYTARARLLPPQQPTPGLSGLLLQGGGPLGDLAGSFFGGKSSSDLYVGILESRSVADKIINKFDLKKLYEEESLEKTYKLLAKQTSITVSRKTQIINISVDDPDPKRAADMANTYVEALDRINRTVNITEGHRKRVFLEDRLGKVKEDLIRAEGDLRSFQEKYKLVSIDQQAKAAIEGAATIKGEIIAAQTELEVLKQFGTERQNEAVMLRSKIKELQNQLNKIEVGNPNNEIKDFNIPFKEFPALGMKLARLMREAKIQEEVFKLITTQHELAKIEEAKDVNTIQVLDRAVAPDRKSRPHRSLIVILTAAVAFFVSIFLAFLMEYLDRLKGEDPERYQAMISGLKIRKTK
jgi:tyrosine-protein kinase Etk/Wzc